jgi:hypothetical protein
VRACMCVRLCVQVCMRTGSTAAGACMGAGCVCVHACVLCGSAVKCVRLMGLIVLRFSELRFVALYN